MRSGAIPVAAVLLCVPVWGASPNDCVWRQAHGSCHASITIFQPTGEYTVRSDYHGCKNVDVLIDGTVYATKFRGYSYDDKVMILDKKKEYSASIASCTKYETKREIYVRCESAVMAAAQGTEQALQAQLAECTAGADDELIQACNASYAQHKALIVQGRADKINACVGDTAVTIGSGGEFVVRSDYRAQ